MTDFIIVGILAGALAAGILGTKKHFKGEGGCCGGSTYKAARKKLRSIHSSVVYEVEGMHCQHCVNRVMEGVNGIEGASAVVDLKKGLVTVSMDREIGEEMILAAIEKAGYEVKGIR